MMIGSFKYASRPHEDGVSVTMMWGEHGNRVAALVLPASLRLQIEADQLPSTDEALSIDGALAYGVVLSMRAGLPLTLSGDLSVWRPEWGQVIQVH